MQTKIFSIDEVELDLHEDPYAPTKAPNVTPIREEYVEIASERCVLSWEGSLDLLPEIGDTIALPSSVGPFEAIVVHRVFHLDLLEKPLLTLFVTSGDAS